MKTKRYERKDITGAEGWEVNAAGDVYGWRHKQEVTNVLAGLPSIDMGPSPREFRVHCIDSLTRERRFHSEKRVEYGWERPDGEKACRNLGCRCGLAIAASWARMRWERWRG